MQNISSININAVLELHTYQQPDGTIIKIIRSKEVYARAVNDFIQQSAVTDKTKKKVADAIAFEKKLGSKLL